MIRHVAVHTNHVLLGYFQDSGTLLFEHSWDSMDLAQYRMMKITNGGTILSIEMDADRVQSLQIRHLWVQPPLPESNILCKGPPQESPLVPTTFLHST
jgi:hypothetical protein